MDKKTRCFSSKLINTSRKRPNVYGTNMFLRACTSIYIYRQITRRVGVISRDARQITTPSCRHFSSCSTNNCLISHYFSTCSRNNDSSASYVHKIDNSGGRPFTKEKAILLLPLSYSVSTAGEALNHKLDYSLTNEQSTSWTKPYTYVIIGHDGQQRRRRESIIC